MFESADNIGMRIGDLVLYQAHNSIKVYGVVIKESVEQGNFVTVMFCWVENPKNIILNGIWFTRFNEPHFVSRYLLSVISRGNNL
jgi:hypothetical protein